MPATTFLANRLLDHQVGKTSYTMPSVWIGLSSTTPNLAGGNITEPSTGGYARQATTGATWATAAAGANSNAVAITWTSASADYLAGANLTHGVLYDAATGGNVLAYGALTVAKNVLNGDTASIAIAGITITIT